MTNSRYEKALEKAREKWDRKDKWTRNDCGEIDEYLGFEICEDDWEQIGCGPMGAAKLYRAPVFGGWIVMAPEVAPDRGSLFFVPDPLNAWKIQKTKK